MSHAYMLLHVATWVQATEALYYCEGWYNVHEKCNVTTESVWIMLEEICDYISLQEVGISYESCFMTNFAAAIG